MNAIKAIQSIGVVGFSLLAIVGSGTAISKIYGDDYINSNCTPVAIIGTHECNRQSTHYGPAF
jgi:hypothetical protein